MKRALVCGLILSAIAGVLPAAAADTLLSKRQASALLSNEVGKPLWSMQAQCSGVFQAGYDFKTAKRLRLDDEQRTAQSLLDRSLARLKADRGISHEEALALVNNEFQYGRSRGQSLLSKSGAGPFSQWNVARSACYEIEEAARVASR